MIFYHPGSEISKQKGFKNSQASLTRKSCGSFDSPSATEYFRLTVIPSDNKICPDKSDNFSRIYTIKGPAFARPFIFFKNFFNCTN